MQHKPSLRQTAEFGKLQKLFRISHRLLKNLNSQCRIFPVKSFPFPPEDSLSLRWMRGIFLCPGALLSDLCGSLRSAHSPRADI